MLEANQSIPPRREGATAWRRETPAEPPIVVRPEGDETPGRITSPQGDITFLNIYGSDVDMGDQLGRRLADDIRSGPVPFFATYLEHILQYSPLGKASEVLRWATHKWITGRLIENIPRSLRDSVEALSAGCGLSVDTLLKAYLMPESFLWLVGQYHKVAGTRRARGLGASPLAGCTSAIVSPPHADTLYHGRNFDYFGVNHWDEHTTVVFHHPDDGMDYVAVNSAGIIGGGITAMNAAGLTLAVHQHFVDDFDLDGVPIGFAGDRVMREAQSIEEAVAVLRDYPPVAGWSYIMTEGDTGRSAVLELAPGRETLHEIEPGESWGYANVYWGEDFEETEIDYYPEYRRSNYARQERVLQRVREIDPEGPAGPRDVADVLGDSIDPDTGRKRLFGRTISNVQTVASVVFEPENRRVWVAAGQSPTARSWFVPFALRPDGSTDGGPDRTVVPFIPEKGWHQTAHGQAFDLYRKAAYRWWEGETSNRLLILIEHALALYPQEPNLHVLAGLLALRVDRGKRAEGAFRRALEQINDPPRRAEVGLFLGWALDLQGQRGAAKHIYKRIMRDDQADPQTHSRARKFKWFRFSASQAEDLPIDFAFAGVP